MRLTGVFMKTITVHGRISVTAIMADEVVVSHITKRASIMTLRAKDFT